MNLSPPTIIIRHKKENLKKCSLRGLENKPGFSFLSYPLKEFPAFEKYILLSVAADEVLSDQDAESGLILLDATWRYALTMEKNIPFPVTLKRKRLPMQLVTAYPRRQDDCPNPGLGLASIEALYAAYRILKRDAEELLDHYYWKEAFMEKNRTLSIFHSI